MAALFAFDFLVEKLSDVREEDQIHAVAFKLLSFSAVSVTLANGKKQRPSGAGRSTIRLSKGKSVVFETDPKALVRGLKQTPMEVGLLTSGTSPLTPPHQPWTAPCVARGVLDLSHMAVSLESVVMPEGLHQNKSQMHHCIFSGRDTIELTDSAGQRAARVRLKCRLAYVSDHIPQKVDETSPGVPHECSETPGRKNEASPKPEGRQEKEERRRGSSIPSPDPSPTPVHVPTPQSGVGTTATGHLNEVVDDIYFPNSVCPPPLFYHSKSKINNHRPSQPPPPISERTVHSAPPNTHSVWCESTAQEEGYDHWSVLAQFDQSTHPLTTQFRDLNPPMKDVYAHPKEAVAVLAEEPVPIRHLPLLSGLLEELSCLYSRAEPCLPAKRLPERVSTSVQTEREIKAAAKPDVRPTQRKKRIRFSYNATRGRFVRECCQPTKQRVKLVPRNKSVLYPPDIQRKRRRIGFPKEKSKGRDLTIPARQLPASKERATAAITEKVARKRSEHEDAFTIGGGETKPAEGTSPVRKLEVFIPRVPQCPFPSLSPSLSSGSSPSPSISPSLSQMSPSLSRREVATLHAETQTEGLEVEGEGQEEGRGVATVPSLQTGAVGTVEGREVLVTSEEESESEDQRSHIQLSDMAASRKEQPPQSDSFAVESQDKLKEMRHPQSTEAAVMLKGESEDGELNHQLSATATAAPQKESVLPVPQSDSFTAELDKGEKASSPQSVDSARYPQSTRASPNVPGNKWRQRRGSDVVHSLSKFNLSRHKFSSVGDISTAAESPLIRSLRTSLPCVLETTASSVDLSRLNRLQTVRSRSHDIGSQTFDSFTDTLEVGGGRGILLKKRLGNSLVYLASSQSSVASEEGWCEGKGEGEEGVVKEEGEEEEGERWEGEGLESEARMAEPGEGSDQEVDYSDDFEYSDNFEDTESSTDSD